MAKTAKTDKKVEVISGYLYYACVVEPKKKYESEDTEWAIDICVDEDTFKSFNKRFRKQKGQSFDADEFKEKFKVDPPYEADEYFVVKLKKPTTKSNGDPLYPPSVLIKKDGKAAPLDKNILVGNGSKGKVSLFTFETAKGEFVRLQSVLVEDLIEFHREAGNGAADDFGLEMDYGQGDFEDGSGSPSEPSGASTSSSGNQTKATPQKDTDEAPWDDDDVF